MNDHSASLPHPKYRPDIDGLRAIAVLSVVGFHAFPSWIKGGFIGVDIFFVISGFLISTIILKGLKTGTFSFFEFYSRRIKRIFPALFLVLVACYAFGWFALWPDEYKQLGKHIAGGAGFVSNFVLWSESGYFDGSARTKPLLHLWSLGIEEQFYIVWPLLMWFAWKKKSLFFITAFFALISFYLSLKGVKIDPIATFYSPLTRFWELLCGSILAWFTLDKVKYLTFMNKNNGWLGLIICKYTPKSNEKALVNASSMIGFLLLIYGFCQVTENVGFPGKWALVPVVGTVLIISAGTTAWLNHTLLSNKVLVWIGLISFPLYLWHWPLLSFAQIMESRTPDLSIRIAAIILAMFLSWLTYKLVERPIRFGRHERAKTIALVLFMLATGVVGYSTYNRDGLKFRKPIKVLAQMRDDHVKPKITRRSDGSCEKKLNLHTNTEVVCLTNDEHPEILIVGDSHAMALNSAAYTHKVDEKTLLIGVHGCLPLVGYSVWNGTRLRPDCDTLANTVIEVAKNSESIKRIYIATRGPFYFTGEGYGSEPSNKYTIVDSVGAGGDQAEMFYKGYSSLISKLIALNKEVVFVIDVPELGEDPVSCIVNRPLTLTGKPVSTCNQDKAKVLNRQLVYREMVQKIKSENLKLKVFDTLVVFCDAKICHGILDDKLLYWDDNHISVSGSVLLMRELSSKKDY